MPIIQSEVRHHTHINRAAAINDGGTRLAGSLGLTDMDPPPDFENPGEEVATWEGVTQSVDTSLASHASTTVRCNSVCKAKVQAWLCETEYLNSHELQSQDNYICTAQDYGRARAERKFVATEEGTKFSGTCSIHSEVWGFTPAPPDPSVIGMKLRAESSVGSAKSWIEAEWMKDEPIPHWHVTYQYFRCEGTSQGPPINGEYDLSGYGALNSSDDFINYEYIVQAGNALYSSAFQNVSYWDDGWWSSHAFNWGSRYQTYLIGSGTIKGTMNRKSTSVVDENYVQRTIKSPRST